MGVGKSGTTDLWNRIIGHPHVVTNTGLLRKEALWWAWGRYGKDVSHSYETGMQDLVPKLAGVHSNGVNPGFFFKC